MKHETLRELIERLWNAGCRGAFSNEALLNRLLEDGGHDTEDLTPEVIADLVEEKHPDSWSIVTFAFGEVISHYLATAQKMSFQQIIASVFSACVLADAARAHECDWSLQHDKVMVLCAMLSAQFELEDFLYVMTYIFGKGGEAPISE